MDQQRRLAAWVIIDGRAYGPEHDLPADIAARITNPQAWPADISTPPEPDSTGIDKTPPPPGTGTADAALGPATPGPPHSDDDVVSPVAVPPPPRSGKGSGVDAWRAYAAVVHVEVAADADRGGIILACEKAGRLTPTGDDGS